MKLTPVSTHLRYIFDNKVSTVKSTEATCVFRRLFYQKYKDIGQRFPLSYSRIAAFKVLGKIHFNSVTLLSTSDHILNDVRKLSCRRGYTDSASRCNVNGHNMPHSVSTLKNIQEVRESPQDILNAFHDAIENGLLYPSEFLKWLLRYQMSVCVDCPQLFNAYSLKRETPEVNFNNRVIIDSHDHPHTDTFEKFTSYLLTNMAAIPLKDIPQMLNALDCLFVPREGELMKKLYDRCRENVMTFNLRELALLSNYLQLYHSRDFHFISQIIQRTKYLLLTLDVNDIDLRDVCKVYGNIKHTMSLSMFELGIAVICEKLKSERTKYNLTLVKDVEQFNEIASFEYSEILDNCLLSLHQKYLRDGQVNFDETELTTEICAAVGKAPSQVFHIFRESFVEKLATYCIAQLRNHKNLTVKEVICFFCGINKENLQGKEEELAEDLSSRVKETDSVLFFQLLHHCHITEVCSHGVWGRRLTSQLVTGLERVLDGLTSDWLVDFLGTNQGMFSEPILWLLNQSVISEEHYRALELKQGLLKEVQCQLEYPDVSSEIVALAMSEALNGLGKGNLMAPSLLQKLTQSSVKFSNEDLILFHQKADELIKSKHPLSVRRQAQLIRDRLHQVFMDTLSRAKDITPPLIHLGHKLRGTARTSFLKGIQNVLVNNVLVSLPQVTARTEERICLRAISVLRKCRHPGFYEEQTLESLTAYVTGQSELSILSGLGLLELLSLSGYQPRDFQIFEIWAHQLLALVMALEDLRKSVMVKAALHMSMLGIFPDDSLQHIFSLDFITDLQDEIADMSKPAAQVVQRELALLNRSVFIECPHLCVVWFCQKHFQKMISGTHSPSYVRGRLEDSIARLCGDPEYVAATVQNPYCHMIDVQLSFNSQGQFIKRRDLENNTSTYSDFEKLAVLLLEPSDLCGDSGRQTGTCQAQVRQLEMLGYVVVLFPHGKLSSIELRSNEALDEFVCSMINASLGWPLFMDPVPRHKDTGSNMDPAEET